MSTLQSTIESDVIDPSVLKNIKDTSSASYFWRKIGNVCEALGKLFVGIQGILAFAASTYNMQTLSFISGAMSILAMALFTYSSYSMQESKERTTELNMLLTYKGITNVPNIAIDSAAGLTSDATSTTYGSTSV